jgi:hypothetical protein
MYILIFKLFNNRWEDRNSGLNGNRHYQNSVSSLFPPESNLDLLLSFSNVWTQHIFKRFVC